MEVEAGCVGNSRAGQLWVGAPRQVVMSPGKFIPPDSYEFRDRTWGGGSCGVSGMSKSVILKGCRAGREV